MDLNAVDYGEDFYGWTQEQAGLLRAGKLSEIDAENLAEEIESMGRSEADKLRSGLRLILLHLLKGREQSERRSRSWRDTIQRERDNAALVLEENPSLKPKLPDLFAKTYHLARREAARETDLPLGRFPEPPPSRWSRRWTRTSPKGWRTGGGRESSRLGPLVGWPNLSLSCRSGQPARRRAVPVYSAALRFAAW